MSTFRSMSAAVARRSIVPGRRHARQAKPEPPDGFSSAPVLPGRGPTVLDRRGTTPASMPGNHPRFDEGFASAVRRGPAAGGADRKRADPGQGPGPRVPGAGPSRGYCRA
ncbi:hypothetical protein TPA0909_23170 [Streptomyces albus]|nr:hypothetical protein TPA0909_23170 [Streptomyces albus]